MHQLAAITQVQKQRYATPHNKKSQKKRVAQKSRTPKNEDVRSEAQLRCRAPEPLFQPIFVNSGDKISTRRDQGNDQLKATEWLQQGNNHQYQYTGWAVQAKSTAEIGEKSGEKRGEKD